MGHRRVVVRQKGKYIDGFTALGMGAWWNPTQAKGRLGWGTRELWFVRKANT